MKASAHIGKATRLEDIFLDTEYIRCATILTRAGILTHLPQSGRMGVVGTDGKEYPMPTQEEVRKLFSLNAELIERKVSQGFDSLELTPFAIPIIALINALKETIIRRASEGEVYQTRPAPSSPALPVRINSEKQVWVWDRLMEALDTDELVYFPQEYSADHRGQSKIEIINNASICGVPGWSIGLVESPPFIPRQGEGKVIGGRNQLETGSSPRDYLQALQADIYHGETGKTIEDFIIRFLTRLETTGEISHDRYDNNSLWLLGQYVKYVQRVKSDLVPTGWWHRDFGRARLDAHRPGNKQCTRNWGAATVVRLRGE